MAVYRRARNRVNHDIRKAKREFFLNSLETPNPRVIWNHIKSSLATTSAVQPRLTIQNFQPQPHAKMMADQFNEHFATITSTFGTTTTTINQSNYTRLRTYIRQKNPENLSFKLPNITTEFVQKQLRKMSATKATGLDGISCKLLKLSAEIIAPHIVNICNASINSAHFPRPWKKDRVVPLYKSGDTNDVMNYRPISVLPIMSKLLERHVHNHLYIYLAEFKRLLDEQSGFRENRSCETVLLKMTDYFLSNIDQGNLCGMVLVDMRKAFDLVNHELLLLKLDLYGCHGNELAWFRSYLSEHYQCVKYRMVLNADKTECMLLGTRQKLQCATPNFCVYGNNSIVKPVQVHKLLGLYVDSNLTWNTHVTKLCAKLRSRLYLFNQVKRLMPLHARKLYFSGMVQPLIDYGCVIWGSCGHSLLMNVHKMMKQYARVILNVKDRRQISTVTLFRTLGWLPIDVRIRYFTSIVMYNVMHGHAPGYLTDLFVLNNSVHNHHTRSCTNIHVKKYNLSLGQRTFAYRGAKLWDTIPECITKNANSVDTFKTHCLKFLVKDVYNCMHFPIDTPE